MIKALFCDFYGTMVFEDDEPIGATVERIYQSGRAEGKEEIGAFWSRRFCALCAEAFGEGFRTQRDLVLQSLQETMDRFHSDENADELCRYQFEYGRKPPIFEDAKPFFAQCPIPVYIISNIDTDDLHSALCFHGLQPAGVVTSEEARAYKPRGEIFTLALRKFGLAQGEVVHIGDSVSSDVMGAKAAGIPYIWINRKGKARPAGVDREAADLLAALSML